LAFWTDVICQLTHEISTYSATCAHLLAAIFFVYGFRGQWPHVELCNCD